MKLAALISGGKDSWLAVDEVTPKHEIKYLVCVEPEPDSPFLHSENLGLVKLQSEVSGIPLVWVESEDEGLEALREAVETISDDIDGLVSGAIASEYQRERVMGICTDLGLECLTPLWKRREEDIMESLLEREFKVIITKVAAQGLDEGWLGRVLDRELLEDLKELKNKNSVNIAGEGGEFETLVLDCPHFNHSIRIKESRKTWEDKTGTGYLEVTDSEH